MTPVEIAELIEWHESRMAELRYPQAIIRELRQARARWLAGVKRV